MAYQDFTVSFEPISDSERYRLVAHSPADGQATSIFALPFGAERIHTWRSGLKPEETPTIGTLLYRRLFSPEICLAFQSTQRFAVRQGLALRLSLALDGKLARLPWEYLYDPDSGQFLCLGGRLALVRYYPSPHGHKPARLTPQLAICIVDGENDGTRPYAYLPALAASNALQTFKLDDWNFEDASPAPLPYQILHLRASGGLDPASGDYALRLSNGAQEQWLSADKIARWLRAHPSVQLVALDFITGAETAAPEASAFAATLVARQFVPAAVTLQYPLPPRLRETFFKTFYRALARDSGLDLAISEGRQALAAMNGAWEWGAPVLFSAGRDDQPALGGLPGFSAETARSRTSPMQDRLTLSNLRYPRPL